MVVRAEGGKPRDRLEGVPSVTGDLARVRDGARGTLVDFAFSKSACVFVESDAHTFAKNAFIHCTVNIVIRRNIRDGADIY